MQELDIYQIDAAVCDAVEKSIPLTVTFESDSWVNLHSRFLAVDGDCLLVEVPVGHDGVSPRLAPAQKVDLSFKLKHHKYLTQARVAEYIKPNEENNFKTEILSLCLPLHMQRIQRRSYSRVTVPVGKIIRASFWSGGKNCEPAGPSGGAVWSGSLTDFSAGGFRVLIAAGSGFSLRDGDSVGVRIAFGNGRESIYSDAQFRHCDTEGNTLSLGFQFVGLAHTLEGRNILRTISQKMADIMRSARRVG